MTTFDDREKAYETKFALDQELAFKAAARRNKLLGLWAAEKLGKSAEAAEEYAKSVIKADLEEPGDEDVFRKIKQDFEQANITISDQELREAMIENMEKAIAQLENEA